MGVELFVLLVVNSESGQIKTNTVSEAFPGSWREKRTSLGFGGTSKHVMPP